MDFDTTVGGSVATSYPSVAEADDYIGTRLHSGTWSTQTQDTKEGLLMWATMLLDSYPRAWTGGAVTETQALRWPRTGMSDRDGRAIAENVIPVALKRATSEMARQLLATDRTADNSVINKGISSIKAGSVALSFENLVTNNSILVARSIRELNALLAVLPDAVKYLLVPSWLFEDPEDLSNDPLFRVI